MTTTVARIQLRRDTAANWVISNPTLAAGETGVETDTKRFKIGDGSTTWTNLTYESPLTPNGSTGSPIPVTAIASITPSGAIREIQFIQGSPGAVSTGANPQIVAGDAIGQELVLQGCSDANTVTLSNGTGLGLNGSCTLKSGSRIHLVWDGTVWGEISRNDT